MARTTGPRQLSSFRITLFLAAVALAAPAAAQPLVLPCSPSGQGDVATLRAAITLANASLAFEVDLWLMGPCTYTFTDRDPGAGPIPVALPVITGKNIWIQGRDATVVLHRDASAGRFRFFEIANGSRLILQKLQLDGGNVPDGANGSGADNSTSAGTGFPGHDGGAVYVRRDGTFSATDVSLTNNTAGAGGTGGECYNGPTSHRGGGFGGPGGRGGAIYNEGSVDITRSTLAHNHGGAGGEGGSCNGGGVTATSGGGNVGGGGGALWNEGGSVTIDGSTIFDNSAGDGGQTPYSGNSGDSDGPGGAGGPGGGLAVNGGSLTVDSSTIESNRAGNGGRGWKNPAGPGGSGGGIAGLSGALTVRRSTISWNTGGAANYDFDKPDTHFSEAGAGGGIHTNGTATIENTTIARNDASPPICRPGGNGGGLHVGELGDVTLTHVTFHENLPGRLYTDPPAPACNNGAINDRYGLGASVYVKKVGDGAGAKVGRALFANCILNSDFWEPSQVAGMTAPGNCAGDGEISDASAGNITFSDPGNSSAEDPGCPFTYFQRANPRLSPDVPHDTTGDGPAPGLTPVFILPGIGSAAVGRASATYPLPSDQRGVGRPQGSDSDIGSVEVRLGTILEHPANAGVAPPTAVTFTARFSSGEYDDPPTAVWRISTDDGATWSDIAGTSALLTGSNGVYTTSYTKSSTASGDDGDRFKAVFTNGVGRVETNAATLALHSIRITSDLTNVTANAGDFLFLQYTYVAFPAVTDITWERSDNGGPWTPVLFPIAPSTGGVVVLPQVVFASMNHTRYRSTLTRSSDGQNATTAIAELTVTDVPAAPSFTAAGPVNSIAVDGDASKPAQFTAIVAGGNPVPTLGWTLNGSPVPSGSLADPDAYHFNTSPGLGWGTDLWFRAWADQDGTLVRAFASNGSGTAFSMSARLFVQVATEIVFDCPPDELINHQYLCHVTVVPMPLRPRARKPCGQVTVDVGHPDGPQSCFLDPNGMCDVTLPDPGQGAPAITHHVQYLGGGTEPCAGGPVPPDLAASANFTFVVGACQKPTFTCPANRTADLGPSCAALVPDFLAGLAAGSPSCPATLTQDPPAGSSIAAGMHDVTITATNSAGSTSCTAKLNVRDTTAPVLTLNGLPTMTVQCHGAYAEPGATVSDCDGTVAVVTTGIVDTTTVGSYTVRYNATDASGNHAIEVTRTVNVVDTVKPTLALNGPSTLTLECHVDGYVELGATATDSCAGTFAATPSGTVNVNAPGTYTVTYNAKDPSGNAADPVTRTVIVRDTIAPVIASCPGNQVLYAVPGTCTAPATYAATANDACGGATPVVFSTPSGSSFPLGVTPVTASATDASGNKSSCGFTVTVLSTPTSTALSLSASPQQYSDGETLTAVVTNGVNNGPVPGGTVTFRIGGSTVGTSNVNASGVATLSLNLVESAVLAKADLAPGLHAVTATYNAGLACYQPSSDAKTLEIAREDARVLYTGALYTATRCTTCADAVVTLSATVFDITATADAAGDGASGDIRNATVTFISVDEGNKELGTVPVGLVNAGDTKVGAATLSWSVKLATSDSQSYTIGIRVDGSYTRYSPNDFSVVTVAKPLTSGFISGGGTLVLRDPAGLKPGDVGSKNNFGFSVQYNKQGTNLQGRINTLVRRLESDGLVHVYQIKGNAMTSLTVNVKGGTAVFNGKASIQDVTNPSAPVPVDGNATLAVTMTDRGEPGSSDTIGIALYNKLGGLWFSSSFENGKTVEQLLAGGNLVVR